MCACSVSGQGPGAEMTVLVDSDNRASPDRVRALVQFEPDQAYGLVCLEGKLSFLLSQHQVQRKMGDFPIHSNSYLYLSCFSFGTAPPATYLDFAGLLSPQGEGERKILIINTPF